MVCINNTPVEDDALRLNLDSSSCIYMITVKEDQCHIVDEDRRKQDEAKENEKRSNSVKIPACIFKRGRLYDNIISAAENLLSANKTTEESTDCILQDTPPPIF